MDYEQVRAVDPAAADALEAEDADRRRHWR
jgi:hypothetical protein